MQVSLFFFSLVTSCYSKHGTIIILYFYEHKIYVSVVVIELLSFVHQKKDDDDLAQKRTRKRKRSRKAKAPTETVTS